MNLLFIGIGIGREKDLIIGIGIGREKDLIIGYRIGSFFISCIPSCHYTNISVVGTKASKTARFTILFLIAKTISLFENKQI